MRKILSLLFYILLCCSIKAQPISEDEQAQKFVHHIEPIGLIIIEIVEPGMTFYNLKTRYNISIEKLYKANPDLDPSFIPLGYPIHIPVDPAAISFSPPVAGEDSIPIFYRVQPKETLYRISKIYLGVPAEVLINLNPRIDEGLSIGQVIHLGWYNPNGYTSNELKQISLTSTDTIYTPLSQSNSEPLSDSMAKSLPDSLSDIPVDSLIIFHITDFETIYMIEGKTIQEQKGLAVWKPGNSQSNYYVLHPSAMVGSYMEITNPMLHRTLTAKVAGRLTSGLYPPKVGLVVSHSVARALGVLDQQFFANWRFVE